LFQVDIGTFVAYRRLSGSAAATMLVRMDAAHAEWLHRPGSEG
jgi:hypothetical protein